MLGVAAEAAEKANGNKVDADCAEHGGSGGVQRRLAPESGVCGKRSDFFVGPGAG